MAEKSEITTLAGKKILVLDDEEMIRQLIESTLKKHGAFVESVANGREGLQTLMDRDFDLLVVDIRMREMDGITFLQEALNIWPWVGVVVMTGYAENEDLERVRVLGVERIIEKPFTRELLLTELQAELNHKKQQQRERKSDGLGLQNVQYQLRILRLLTEPALKADSLLDALRSMTTGLSRSLQFSLVGAFAIEQDQYVAIFNVQDRISEEFLDHVKQSMNDRYQALTGQKMPDSLRVEIEGASCKPDGAKRVGSSFFIPIIAAGEMKGLLILADAAKDAHTTADISFIYHIANHFSTVFAALDRMRDLAIHDPMTGLYNRLHLEEEYENVWKRSVRYGYTMGVLIMDLDHFKMINDTYGHVIGDRVLKEFAELLKKTARGSDIIGRYGGEEFVIIIPEGGREEAAAFAERLLATVRSHLFCSDTHALYLTVSIGVSVVQPREDDGRKTEDLLVEADSAMYIAKRAGRNCVRIWSGDETETPSPTKAAAKPTKAAEDIAYTSSRSNARIMVVDDDSSIRQLLKMMLAKDGYKVTAHESGDKALADFENANAEYDIVLADLQMPGISGIELLKKIQAIDESVINIIISGHATVSNAIESLRYGAYDFIQKPFVYRQLSAVMTRALEYRRAIQENKQYQRHLSEMVKQKSAKVQEALEQIKGSYEFTLEALVGLLDAREKDFGQHSKRVRELAMVLARQLKIKGEDLTDIAHGALLHDIGKIGIPDAVLLKKGHLTEAEWEVMKKHSEIGYRTLSSSPYLKNAAEIVFSHQECYDGSGYPRGLKGEEICLGARIFALIDAYDAMRSHRSYRAALSKDEAVKEIVSKSGSQFDPKMVNAFIECQAEIERVFLSLQEPTPAVAID
jgi:diguanylate cyclase (GGDEF)-like protein/putative nucleotidyltransferase with HDIG domain